MNTKSIAVLMIPVFVTSLHAAMLAQDTVVVRADNVPLWGEGARLTEDLRIGMLDGPDEYIFGRVGALAVRDDGSIYVFDYQVPVIRQYNAAGNYVRDVGREGSGPGEYRTVLGMHVLRNGRLAVWDVGNTRVTVYDSAGNDLDSYRVPSSIHTANPFAVDTIGNFYVVATDRIRMQGGVVREGQGGRAAVRRLVGEIPKLLIKVSLAGDVLDSISRPAEDKGPACVLMTAEGRRWNFPTAVRYAWSNLGYLVVGRNDEYAFDLQIPGGPVRRIVRDVEPVRIRRAERIQWEAWTRLFERRGDETYPPIPETKPAYRDLYVDEDGRIWVDRYVAAVKREAKPREPGDDRPLSEWREPSTFDVIGPDGSYFGTVVVPENTTIMVRRGDHAWGVHRGEFDEQYVVRFKINRQTR